MNQTEIKEVAAEAAVVNNAANAASVEPAKAAANLLEMALDTSEGARKRQCDTFGRHWTGTKKLDVIRKGAEKQLEILKGWVNNLEELLQVIAQQEATERCKAVVEGADGLSPDELQAMIAALQQKVAAKAS